METIFLISKNKILKLSTKPESSTFLSHKSSYLSKYLNNYKFLSTLNCQISKNFLKNIINSFPSQYFHLLPLTVARKNKVLVLFLKKKKDKLIKRAKFKDTTT